MVSHDAADGGEGGRSREEARTAADGGPKHSSCSSSSANRHLSVDQLGPHRPSAAAGLHQLLARAQWIVPPRDFHSEVRGPLDVEHLLGNCAVLLDLTEMELEDIVMRMAEEGPGSFGGEPISARGKSRRRRHQSVSFSGVRQKLFIPIGRGRDTFKHVNALTLREHLQGILVDAQQGIIVDQSWLALYCPIEDVPRPRVAFARLSAPTNFGPELADMRFVILVIGPAQQKETKSVAEIARTFGTLMTDCHLRNELATAQTEAQFVDAIRRKARQFGEEPHRFTKMDEQKGAEGFEDDEPPPRRKWFPGRGVLQDLRRRLPFYKSDFLDGIVDSRSFQKTISSATFLYFIVLPTAIALGMLNEENTKGKITVTKAILGQWIGGLVFGLFGGQLFLMMLTSPPISIYITVIDNLSRSTGFDFFQLYSGIGVWCCIYLFLFALFEASNVMKYAKRSLEELFSMFIASTLVINSVEAAVASLRSALLPHCSSSHGPHPHPSPPPPPPYPPHHDLLHPPPPPPPLIPPHLDPLNCNRAVGLLFLLLMLGTAWTALTLANFRKTPFLGKRKREIVSDYALPLAVVLLVLVANVCFGDVPKETFNLDPRNYDLSLGAFWLLPFKGQLICCVLGFPLTILFTMDQMIVTETVDNSQNNLKKGPAANWDFLVVALLNVPLSLFGLPWMHAALPQSFLHPDEWCKCKFRAGIRKALRLPRRFHLLGRVQCHWQRIVPTDGALLHGTTFLPAHPLHSTSATANCAFIHFHRTAPTLSLDRDWPLSMAPHPTSLPNRTHCIHTIESTALPKIIQEKAFGRPRRSALGCWKTKSTDQLVKSADHRQLCFCNL